MQSTGLLEKTQQEFPGVFRCHLNRIAACAWINQRTRDDAVDIRCECGKRLAWMWVSEGDVNGVELVNWDGSQLSTGDAIPGTGFYDPYEIRLN